MAENFWFKFYFKDWSDDVKPLSLASRGLLIELIIELRKRGGSMPVDVRLISRLTGGLTEEITGGLQEFRDHGIFDFEKTDAGEIFHSRKILKEISKSLINKENGKKGGNPLLKSDNPSVNRTTNRRDNRTPNSISDSNSDFNYDSNSKKSGFKKFQPPDPNEVAQYMAEINYPAIVQEEAQTFVNFYASKGWMIGKNKMKDWKASVRTWKQKKNEQPNPKTGTLSDERLAVSLAAIHNKSNMGGD